MVEKGRNEEDICIHTGSVSERSIPEAFWSAMKLVYDSIDRRTQYDRKDARGIYIDPPGKDKRVMIEIIEPFAEPRFPQLSYCEIGKYIAEMLGVKDHLVVPYEELLEKVAKGEEFEAKEWPYCYHDRLTSYPTPGGPLNQLERLIDMLAKDPITRRAVAITGVPEIDLFLKADAPCLREIQLRAPEDSNGRLVLHMMTRWRSRDLYKAWGDNVIVVTNLQARLAARLAEKTGKEVIIGPYSDESGSLHVYGQDRAEKGADKFFEQFPTKKAFVERAWTSEKARDGLIIPQLEDLLKLNEIEQWKFGPKQIKFIVHLIDDFESGKFVP